MCQRTLATSSGRSSRAAEVLHQPHNSRSSFMLERRNPKERSKARPASATPGNRAKHSGHRERGTPIPPDHPSTFLATGSLTRPPACCSPPGSDRPRALKANEAASRSPCDLHAGRRPQCSIPVTAMIISCSTTLWAGQPNLRSRSHLKRLVHHACLRGQVLPWRRKNGRISWRLRVRSLAAV